MFRIATVPGAMNTSPQPVTRAAGESLPHIRTQGILWKVSAEWPSRRTVPQGWGWEPGLPAASKLDVKLAPIDVGGVGEETDARRQSTALGVTGCPAHAGSWRHYQRPQWGVSESGVWREEGHSLTASWPQAPDSPRLSAQVSRTDW